MFKTKLIEVKNKVQEIPTKVTEYYEEQQHHIKPWAGLIATQVVLSVVAVLVSRSTNSMLDSFCEGLESTEIEVD